VGVPISQFTHWHFLHGRCEFSITGSKSDLGNLEMCMCSSFSQPNTDSSHFNHANTEIMYLYSLSPSLGSVLIVTMKRPGEAITRTHNMNCLNFFLLIITFISDRLQICVWIVNLRKMIIVKLACKFVLDLLKIQKQHTCIYNLKEISYFTLASILNPTELQNCQWWWICNSSKFINISSVMDKYTTVSSTNWTFKTSKHLSH